jgi:ubiquitin conjugation factor E4 B
MADLAADLAGAVAQLVAVTGCEPHQALTLLQQSGGNIEMAANEFFFSSEAGAGDASGGEDDDGMTDGSMTDDYDEAAADAVMGEAAAAAPLPMSRPPPKRPKLEQRPAPQLPEADAAALRMAKEVFALAAVPADAGDKLHRAVRERMESWAYGDDRGLRYLLGCWGRAKRLEGAAAPSPVSSFAVDSVLYHARSTLVSGAADDDGLSLFGHSEEGEVAGLLRSSFASAAPFVAGVNASMSETEQELIYGPAIEAVLRKLDPYSGGAVIPVGGSTTSAVGWRGLLDEAEALLGLVGGGSGAPLKPAPHGAAARAVLGRRMAEETARLRAGEWSGREAEGLGLLRLFSTAPAGLPGYGLAKTPAGGGSCHHDDAGVLRAAWDEVWQLQTRQRLILTAAVLKESESRTAALNWIGAVLAANVAAVEPAHAQPGAEAAVARARAAASAECTVLNLSSVLLQLCAPFLEVSAERTGKGHDGYSRLDTLWLEREGVRAEASRGPKARHAPPPREPTLRQDGATGKAGGGGGPAGGAENGGDAGEFGENNEEADELAQAIRMSLLSSEGSPSAAPSAAAPAPAVAGSGVRAEMEHHFVTECFFLAMKAVHVGRLPAMRRSERQVRRGVGWAEGQWEG